MYTTISNKIIREFKPCYDPADVVEDESEELPIVEWVQKYRKLVPSEFDIIWLLCRKEFMSDKDMRLFAAWCARSTYEFCTKEHPLDQRSIDAVDCAERFADGVATEAELSAARSAARLAAESAAWSAARLAAWSAAESAARSAQIDKLITYFQQL